MTELQDLHAVIHVADTGSFREAANIMGISAATLTRRIQRVESTCDFEIFERSNRAIFLTQKGSAFVEHCRKLHRSYELFWDTAGKIRGGQPPLRISVGPLASSDIAVPTLRALKIRHPDMRASVSVSAREAPIAELRARNCDIAICDLTYVVPFEEIETIVLKKSAVCLVVRPDHPLAQGGPHDWESAFQYPVCLPHLHKYWLTSFRRALGGDCWAQGTSFQFCHIECDDYRILTELALTGEFVTGGVRSLFSHHLSRGDLVEVSLQTAMYSNLCAARLSAPQGRLVEECWNHIRDCYAV